MSNDQARHLPRSFLAVFVGFITIAGASLGVDQLLHTLQVYPPWDQPLTDSRLLILALGYRTAFGVLGSYVTAALAPRHPMRHALVLGMIGLVLSTLGALATLPLNLGPMWYPIALVITALPTAWAGGKLYGARQ